MAALNFPSNPTLNQEYTPAGGPTWVYNGESWDITVDGTSAVNSVAGKTGDVTLVKADITDFDGTDYATSAQGALADSATQPGDNISTLNNDSGYITDPGVSQIVAGTNVTISPVGGTGAVTINASGGGGGALGDLSDVTIASAATGEVLRYNGAAWVDAQLAYGDISGTPAIPTNTSDLTNNSGFITDPGVSQIVAGTNVTISPVGGTGAVTINASGGGSSPTVTALTPSASITPDFSVDTNFSLALNTNTTINNPTNVSPGQSGAITITQTGGTFTAAYGSNWKFEGGSAPSLTATNGAVDVLVYYVESATRISTRVLLDVK